MSPRPTKSAGNKQARAKDALQHVHVLGRRDAAEQHDAALRPDIVGDRAGAVLEGPAVFRVGRVDVDPGEVPERAERDRRIDRAEAGVRGDDEGARARQRRVGIGRPRERARVGELAAEIKATQKRKHVADRRSLRGPQLHRELERRPLRHDHRRAPAAAVCRGQEKDLRGHLTFRIARKDEACSPCAITANHNALSVTRGWRRSGDTGPR